MTVRLISQGAEARVFEVPFCGRRAVLKERFSKKYRVPELDRKLTTRRTHQEVRCYLRCRKSGIDTPVVYMVDGAKIYMEKVEGVTVKHWLQDNMTTRPEEALLIACSMGRSVARMHDALIGHGDLTTSNFMVRDGGSAPSPAPPPAAPAAAAAAATTATGAAAAAAAAGAAAGGARVKGEEEGEGEGLGDGEGADSTPATMAVSAPSVVLIDFGLGFRHPIQEDRAVDLYVLERAFTSTHANSDHLVAEVLRSYQAESRTGDTVLKHLQQVRSRGRKKDMVG